MNNKQTLGKLGEEAALNYLKSKGKEILHFNLRIERKEVDIVFLDGDILVFAEVKTRINFDFGYPETAVDQRKQSHIKMVAELYLLDHPEYLKLRFDVISILMKNREVLEIHHIEDAFY